MKLFFTLVSMCLCIGTLHAQKAQKATVERLIEAIRNTPEEDFPILYPMLKITQEIPAEQGGMEKLRQVFAIIKTYTRPRADPIHLSRGYRADQFWTDQAACFRYSYLRQRSGVLYLSAIP